MNINEHLPTVFLTGADRGIGFALCQEFLAHHYHVYAGQYMPDWPALTELQKEYPDQLSLIPLDIGDPNSINRAYSLLSQSLKQGFFDQKREQIANHCDYINTEHIHLDYLIHVAGIALDDSAENMKQMYRINAIGPLTVTETFLPLLKDGFQRLCFVSSEAGSISLAHRTGVCGYGMSKAALNMGVKILFNRLRPQGYTFRLYHPGWVRSFMHGDTVSTIGTYTIEETAAAAFECFTTDADCEDILVMTDVEQETWSF